MFVYSTDDNDADCTLIESPIRKQDACFPPIRKQDACFQFDKSETILSAHVLLSFSATFRYM